MSSLSSVVAPSRSVVRRLVVPVIAALALLVGALGSAPAQAATTATYTVSVTVTGGGAPRVFASVDLYQYDSGSKRYEQVAGDATDDNGKVTFRSVKAGKYRVIVGGGASYVDTVGAPFLVSANKTLAIVSAVGGTMSGTVIEDGTGTPLSGIHVTAYRATNTGIDESRAFTGTTDGDGHFSFGGMGAGSYKVQFEDHNGTHASEFYQDAGDAATAKSLTVALGADTPVGTTSLAVGGTFTGTVLDDAGAVVPDVEVAAYPVLADGSIDTYDRGYVAYPDENGAFAITKLPTGLFKVVASADSTRYFAEWSTQKPSAAAADALGATAGVSSDIGPFTLARAGSVSGTVKSAAGAVLKGIRIDYYAVDGGVVSTTPGYEYRVTTSTGKFSVKPLRAGTYRVVVSDPTHVYATKTLPDVTVAVGGSYALGDVTLAKTVPATVKVTASGGKGKATFTVKVSASGVTPTGKVTVKLGSKTLKTATLISGKATVTVTGQAKGKRSYTVVYSGDAKVGAKTVTTSKVTIT